MFLDSLLQHSPSIGVFLTLLIGGVGFPIPEAVTLLVCGFLIFNGLASPAVALPLAFAGMLLGDLILYLLGRKYGGAVASIRLFRRLRVAEGLSEIESKVRDLPGLPWLILVGRHLGGAVILAAGTLRVPFGRFITAEAIASVLTMAIWVSLGYFGAHSVDAIRRDITRIEHGAVILVVAGVAVWLVVRSVRKVAGRGR